jgi:hypothetical protein
MEHKMRFETPCGGLLENSQKKTTIVPDRFWRGKPWKQTKIKCNKFQRFFPLTRE